MAKRARAAVSSNLQSRAAELGVPVKQGTVRAVGGRFYLKIGSTQYEIPVGETNSAADVRRLAGQQVHAITSGRNVVAIAAVKGFRPPIICYIPAVSLVNEIGTDMRAALINKYVEANVIPKEVGNQLIKALG
jgi:hypothetical protein